VVLKNTRLGKGEDREKVGSRQEEDREVAESILRITITPNLFTTANITL
jgi:hypothetical protein